MSEFESFITDVSKLISGPFESPSGGWLLQQMEGGFFQLANNFPDGRVANLITIYQDDVVEITQILPRKGSLKQVASVRGTIAIAISLALQLQMPCTLLDDAKATTLRGEPIQLTPLFLTIYGKTFYESRSLGLMKPVMFQGEWTEWVDKPKAFDIWFTGQNPRAADLYKVSELKKCFDNAKSSLDMSDYASAYSKVRENPHLYAYYTRIVEANKWYRYRNHRFTPRGADDDAHFSQLKRQVVTQGSWLRPMRL